MPTIDQGGNAFGTDMIIGTTDNQAVEIIVNNSVKSVHRSSNIGLAVPLINNTSINNAKVDLNAAGTIITRDVADVAPALMVNQNNTGSTGNIQEWKFNGDTKAYVKPNGTFVVPNGLDGTTLQLDSSVSNFIITASPSNSWARGLRFRNSSDTAFLAGYGLYGTSGTSYQYGWMGVAYNNANIKWNNTGLGVGLTGTTAPSYPLHVDIGTVTGTNILGHFGQNGGSLRISNGTGTSNQYAPYIYGVSTNTSVGLGFVAQGKNSYTIAAFSFSARDSAGTGTVTSGNIFELSNFTTQKLSIDHSGDVTINGLSGTGTRIVTADSTGTLSTTTAPTSGTYTPTITGSESYTPSTFIYTRVDNVVHVTGNVAVSGPTGGDYEFFIELPVATTIYSSEDVSGVISGKFELSIGTSTVTMNNYVEGDTTGNTARVSFTSAVDAKVYVQFDYIVQ